MTLPPETSEGIAFGRFRLLPRRRELLADDEPIRLGGRAFEPQVPANVAAQLSEILEQRSAFRDLTSWR